MSNSEGRRDERDERHAFDDVNFPSGRPRTLLAQRPKGGPGGTARGHMREVEHENSFVIRALRRDADAITPTGAGANDGPIVGTHHKCITVR